MSDTTKTTKRKKTTKDESDTPSNLEGGVFKAVAQIIEKSPLKSIAGLIFVVVAATYSVCLFVFQHKQELAIASVELVHKQDMGRKDAEMARLTEQLGGIERRFGNSDFIDVTKFFVADVKSINASAQFFPESRMYVTTNFPNWQYRTITFEGLIKFMGNEVSQQLKDLSKAGSFYYWDGGKTFSIAQAEVTNTVPVFGAILCAKNEDIREVIGFERDEKILYIDFENKKVNVKGTNFFDNISRHFQGDLAGGLLAFEISHSVNNLSLMKDMNVSLEAIEKKGNVVHLQRVVTLKNQIINEVKKEWFFIHLEYFIITTQDRTFIIVSVLPSEAPRPRGAYAEAINSWLGSIYIAN